MKLTQLSLAMASVIGATVAADALALDLYVDNKTQQIFAEPGANRSKLGEFVKAGDKMADAAQAAEIAKIKEELALKGNEMKAMNEHIEVAEESKVSFNTKDGGLGLSSKDGNFTAKMIGRMQVDAQTNISGNDSLGAQGANPLVDGAALRRARLGIEGTFYKDFGYKFEYDFAGTGTTVNAGLTDAYLSYKGLKDFNFQVGQFKEPYAMEIQTSNRFIPFIERSMMANAFSDGWGSYKTGLGATYAKERWAAKVAIQTAPTQGGGDMATNSGAHAQGDSSYQLAARVTGMPWMQDKTHLVHLGASGMVRDLSDTAAGFNIRAAMGGNYDRTVPFTFAVPASSALGPKTMIRTGVESAVVYGPFAAMAEYTQVHLDGKNYNGSNLGEDVDGYYAYASYFLTGESLNYKASTGSFDRVTPKKNFDMKGGYGAWQVLIGYDALNLKDGTSINAGTAKVGKVGVNWYLNPRFKFMTNLVQTLDINIPGSASNAITYNNKDLTMLDFRAQVDF